MRRSQYLALTATAAAALGTVGYGAATSLASPVHKAKVRKPVPALKLAKASVKQGSGSEKASVLVNAKGRAVYLLTGDSVKHPLCTSTGCLGAWPAVTASVAKPALGPGIKGKLTIWKHKGMHQLVLNGHPLYTFAGDKSADVANGQGLADGGSVWKVLAASGAAAPIAVVPVSTGTTTSGTTVSTSGTTPSGSTPSGSNAPAGSTPSSGSAPSSAGTPAAGTPSTPSGSTATPGKTTPSTATTPSGQTTPSSSSTPSGSTNPPTKTTPSGTTTPSTPTPSTSTPSAPPPVDNWA